MKLHRPLEPPPPSTRDQSSDPCAHGSLKGKKRPITVTSNLDSISPGQYEGLLSRWAYFLTDTLSDGMFINQGEESEGARPRPPVVRPVRLIDGTVARAPGVRAQLNIEQAKKGPSSGQLPHPLSMPLPQPSQLGLALCVVPPSRPFAKQPGVWYTLSN